MKSKPLDYTTFRTFIFGITSQSMFPDGVVYEGINDGKPMSFRGESGANDSMIPTMDNFLQIPMVSKAMLSFLICPPSSTISCSQPLCRQRTPPTDHSTSPRLPSRRSSRISASTGRLTTEPSSHTYATGRSR